MFQKNFVEKIETHFMFRKVFLENRAVYKVLWKTTVARGRTHMKIWRMRIACLIPKATNTHSACVILISLPPQQGVHELRYTYITDSLSTCARDGHLQV